MHFYLLFKNLAVLFVIAMYLLVIMLSQSCILNSEKRLLIQVTFVNEVFCPQESQA